MAEDNVIVGKFCGGANRTVAKAKWRYDYGQVLRFEGLTLPNTYQVHISNDEFGLAEIYVGNATGVAIPWKYFYSGLPIYAWIFLSVGVNDGETKYLVKIPIMDRAYPYTDPPSSEQLMAIQELISQLNTGVSDAEAWAVGQRSGVDVESDDPTYHNNSKYYSEQSSIYASNSESFSNEAFGYAQRSETAEGNARDYQNLAQQDAYNASQSRTDAEAAAREASMYSSRANGYANDASASADRAEQAANNAGYMEIDVNQYGHLIYTRTDAVDVDFSLSMYGHLVMEAIT